MTGFVDHMNFVSEMARTCIYETKALVAYDEEMLERARRWGVDVFHGADTVLTNSKLGVAGTKAATAAMGGGRPQGGNYQKGKGRYGSGNKKQSSVLAGWKKTAGDRGICFKYCQGFPCDVATCSFKHKCVNCDSFSHGMSECKVGGSDSKG